MCSRTAESPVGGQYDLSVLYKLPLAAVLRIDWGSRWVDGVSAGRPVRRLPHMPCEECWGPEHGGCHGDGEKWVDAKNV